MNSDPSGTPRIFYGWYIVAAGFVSLSIHAGVGFYSFPVFLTEFNEYFGWGRGATNVGMSIMFITGALVSPFVGRLDDIAHDGMDLISQIRQIYDNYGMDTELLVASIRHPQHVVESALLGADCATIPPKVLWQMAKHPLTDRGIDAFLKDWASLKQEL